DAPDGHTAGVGEGAADEQRGTAAVVEDMEGMHLVARARAQRGPVAVVARDAGGGLPAGRGELAAGVEARTGSVVEHDERVDSADIAGDQLPRFAVPAEEAVEVTAGVESGARAIVIDGQGADTGMAFEPFAHGRPLGSIPAGDVGAGDVAGVGEGAAD